jgi:hypothetical protein
LAAVKESSVRSASGDGRSVNYPFVTLEAAMEQARRLWASVGRNMVPMSTAGAAWGYGEKSSGLRSTVSALKQYGLLQDVVEGGNRQVRVTDRALDILLEPPGSPKHRNALGAAVLTPKIYREVFDRFPAGLPAQDHAISSFLLRERDFNRKAVARFIAGLRANIQFAGVHHPGPVPPFRGQQATVPSAAASPLPAAAGPPNEDRTGAGLNQDVYTLGGEGKVLLLWPEKISQASYNELSDWIELQLKKIARINGLKRRRPRGRF